MGSCIGSGQKSVVLNSNINLPINSNRSHNKNNINCGDSNIKYKNLNNSNLRENNNDYNSKNIKNNNNYNNIGNDNNNNEDNKNNNNNNNKDKDNKNDNNNEDNKNDNNNNKDEDNNNDNNNINKIENEEKQIQNKDSKTKIEEKKEKENKEIESKIDENNQNIQIENTYQSTDDINSLRLCSPKIDSDLRNSTNKNKLADDETISLGINIGALNTIFSLFFKKDNKYISHVLLMNNSSRIIPSIICYTKDHRLFGENSITSLKQNLNTSYNNLSRLIGYDNKIEIYKDEILYGFEGIKKLNSKSSYYQNSEEKEEEIKSENIISDFLSLIKKYYIVTENNTYTSTFISVPDFYTSYQKECIRMICQSLNFYNVNIFNESSALTMYYGYTKYRDNFVKGKNKVDSTIMKYILFIDSGHSKTSFILSKFNYNIFKVIYVLTLPFIGGRNFDEKIIEYSIEEFIKKKNINSFELTPKMKYRLLEVVRKTRIQLTVNTDSNILVDVFYQNEDLELVLKREIFENLIKDYVKEIDIYLKKMIDYTKNNKIEIDSVEIAGELMRTPILQKVIEDNKLKISKSLLIDEASSVGAGILGNYILGKLPIANFKKFYNYNFYIIDYEIIQNKISLEKKKLLNIGIIVFNEVKIKINKNYIKEDFPIFIKLSYNDSNENNNVKLCTNNLLLVEYEINLFKIVNDLRNKIKKECEIYFQLQIDNAQKLTNGIIIFNEEKYNENIKIINDNGLYKFEKDKKLLSKQIILNHIRHKSFDSIYYNFINKKNEVSKYLYLVKTRIEKISKLKDHLNKIKDLDKKIHKIKDINNKKDLEEINKEVKEIDKITINKLEEIIDNLLESLNQNNEKDKQKIETLNNMKETLKNHPEDLDYNEFNMMLNCC